MDMFAKLQEVRLAAASAMLHADRAVALEIHNTASAALAGKNHATAMLAIGFLLADLMAQAEKGDEEFAAATAAMVGKSLHQAQGRLQYGKQAVRNSN